MGDDRTEGARYRAFISYSHVDQAFGRKLHRRLERYALPGRLVGRETARGAVPRRIAPVFRDREEFSAAGDLTAEVRAALAASEALIVVCSPAAAASPWVAREIELFRELHPHRPVLAAVVAGEPAGCFPAPLTAAGEPLAADFRLHADGPRLGLLKLVAGVAGVGLDELVQRDAQRRLIGVTAITSAAVAVALVMTALTTFAVLAQREAERQRGQAEALVEFMLTDLRDRLKGVGRLDVLGSVNERTLRYYADQDVGDLPAASQARYARILMAMGEDDVSRGDLPAAGVKFSGAGRITGRLLAERPAEPERLWAHGQSEYWVGYAAYRRGDTAETGRRWRSYRALAQALVDQNAADPKYLRELGYADGNLCSLALKTEPSDVPEALSRCGTALATMERVASLPGAHQGLADDLVTRHAWMGDAYFAAGDKPGVLRERLTQDRLLSERLAGDPRNMSLRYVWVVLQRELARLEKEQGRVEAGRARMRRASAALDEMLAFEPSNRRWIEQRRRFDRALAEFGLSQSQEGEGNE
jgi:hypothetical protein